MYTENRLTATHTYTYLQTHAQYKIRTNQKPTEQNNSYVYTWRQLEEETSNFNANTNKAFKSKL
jgi:hypothetical protein